LLLYFFFRRGAGRKGDLVVHSALAERLESVVLTAFAASLEKLLHDAESGKCREPWCHNEDLVQEVKQRRPRARANDKIKHARPRARAA